MKLFFKIYFLVILTLFGALFFYPLVFAQNAPINTSSTAQNTKVNISNNGLYTRLAPGESLPISIKLSNFGGGNRVDVTVNYQILNSNGNQIYTTTETVAVETTASYIKILQIPFNTPPGNYIVKTSITYQNQLVPATAQFSFTVENKIFGFFQREFLMYAIIILIVIIALFFLGRIFIKYQKMTRFTPLDYSNVPYAKRVFFELLSDTIMQMRSRVGDAALDIAMEIDGLVIDKKTGRVLDITQNPSKIIAELVLMYDKALKQKVSFSFRNKNSI